MAAHCRLARQCGDACGGRACVPPRHTLGVQAHAVCARAIKSQRGGCRQGLKGRVREGPTAAHGPVAGDSCRLPGSAAMCSSCSPGSRLSWAAANPAARAGRASLAGPEGRLAAGACSGRGGGGTAAVWESGGW